MIEKLKVKTKKSKLKNQKSPPKADPPLAEKIFTFGRKNLKFLVLSCSFALCVLRFAFPILAQEGFVYKSSGKRDPMIPLVTPQGLIRDIKSLEAGDGFSLEGIIYDEKTGESFAIINGEILKTGEIVSGAEILEIKKDKVILFSDGVARQIGLEKEEGQ